MIKNLKGKVGVVTGASKGIGASIARHLGEAGAAVVVNYATDKVGADRVVADIVKGGGKAIAVQVDLSKPEKIRYLFDEAKKAFGGVDILVNNAGIYEFSPLEEITAEHYHKIIDMNVMSLLLVTQEAVKHFKSSGSIINISSVASSVARPTSTVYTASKAAVDAITRVLSKELGPRGIRVNSINPGLVETEGTKSMGIMDSDFRRLVEEITPLKRFGMPQDIAPAAVFLASDDASWITGECLVIAGGRR